MKSDDLERRLAVLRAEEIPPCSASMASIVLQRVRAERQGGATEGGYAALSRLSLRPQVLAAAFALTVALGALTTTVAASQFMPSNKGDKDVLGLSMLKQPYILECCLEATMTHHDY